MDEVMNTRLREQERALQSVIATFVRLHSHARALGSGADWFGPASAAYDAGIAALHLELRAAQVRLDEALSDTSNAIVTSMADLDAGGRGG